MPRQPDDLTDWPLYAKLLFVILWIAGMALIAIYIIPAVDRNIGFPLGDWVYDTIRQWTGEPPRPPRT